MATNRGIDYGMGKANVDPETGIRHVTGSRAVLLRIPCIECRTTYRSWPQKERL